MAIQLLQRKGKQVKLESLVRQAHERFASAIESMFAGDCGPLGAVWSHDNDVSMFDPFGGRLQGWDQVRSMFEQCSTMIQSGHISSQDLKVYTGGDDLAYTTSYESGELLTKDGQSVKFGMRASSIYRNENGKWKLVHHQVDESPALKSLKK